MPYLFVCVFRSTNKRGSGDTENNFSGGKCWETEVNWS